ncbi:hypothetical protein GCM10027589_08830 [Actinocorallia lasiicapitis]
MEGLADRVDGISSPQELSDFVEKMSIIASSPERPGWENADLPRFFEAISAWIADMDGFFANQGIEGTVIPSWKLFGEMLLAATMYE